MVAVLVLALNVLPAVPAAAQTRASTTVTFNHTGGAQSWAVPNDSTFRRVLIEVNGAEGGSCGGSTNLSTPGMGGNARGWLDVAAGEVLTVYVGGKGAAGYNDGTYKLGGFNGGGRGSDLGGGGGGASDVRRGGSSLDHRVIVGGGGGACDFDSTFARDGGDGGGLAGGTGLGNGGGGGTQVSGGAASGGSTGGPEDGSWGQGGSSNNPSADLSGGGGGYYGGGAGYTDGAGGGSGFASTVLVQSSMSNGVQAGAGKVVITYEPAGSITNLAPTDGATWSNTSKQEFLVTATDPHGDTYHGAARVTDLDSGVVRTFTSVPVGSGTAASVLAVPPLPPGRYQWQAQACDHAPEPWGSSCSAFSSARTLTVLGNRPAQVSSVVSPAAGHTWSTSDGQSFAVQGSDPDGDRFVAKFEVVASTAAFDSSGEVEFYSSLTNNGGVATASPPQKFAVGTYKWRASLTDTGSGRPGALTAERSFTVAAAPPPAVNQPPAVPTLVSPANGHTFLSGDVQEFVANATDPEGDAYIADFRLTHETGIQITFSSSSTASGSNATGRPPAKLPSGNYAWQAKARPASGTGFGSDWSAQRTFNVAPAGANRSPDAPTLVSPAAGHAYSGAAKQTFTVHAIDRDNDIYRAQIEVERRDALNNLTGYWSFETAPAMSDSETSALLNEQLGTGSYRWRARAVDDAGSGAYGLPSDWRSFTVS